MTESHLRPLRLEVDHYWLHQLCKHHPNHTLQRCFRNGLKGIGHGASHLMSHTPNRPIGGLVMMIVVKAVFHTHNGINVQGADAVGIVGTCQEEPQIGQHLMIYS